MSPTEVPSPLFTDPQSLFRKETPPSNKYINMTTLIISMVPLHGKKKTLKFEVNFFFFLVYPPPGLVVNSPYLIHVPCIVVRRLDTCLCKWVSPRLPSSPS